MFVVFTNHVPSIVNMPNRLLRTDEIRTRLLTKCFVWWKTNNAYHREVVWCQQQAMEYFSSTGIGKIVKRMNASKIFKILEEISKRLQKCETDAGGSS